MSPRTDTASLPPVGPCPSWHVRELTVLGIELPPRATGSGRHAEVAMHDELAARQPAVTLRLPGRPRYPLQPDRRPRHPGRAESPGRPPTPVRAHRRARPRAQRPDRAAGTPRPTAAAPAVARPAGPGYQRTARGRSGRADLPPG